MNKFGAELVLWHSSGARDAGSPSRTWPVPRFCCAEMKRAKKIFLAPACAAGLIEDQHPVDLSFHSQRRHQQTTAQWGNSQQVEVGGPACAK